MKIKRALISVSNKKGLPELVEALNKLGVEIVSTGNTAKFIREQGVEVRDVSQVTGFPEILGGRIKTLHPFIYGGVLAKESEEHLAVLDKYGIPLFDMVVINLYPFEKTIADTGCNLHTAIENIDIGGPALIRAAAKNYRRVTVVSSPESYSSIIDELESTGAISYATRQRLSVVAFSVTMKYDFCIHSFLNDKLLREKTMSLHFVNGKKLRYGENSHQEAMSFELDHPFLKEEPSVITARKLGGKELSYNNIVDADAAMKAVNSVPDCVGGHVAVSVIKHGNPCGFATGESSVEALEKAWEGDPISAFGGVVACNSLVDVNFVNFVEFLKGDSIDHWTYTIKDGEPIKTKALHGKFIEVLLAPGYTPEALRLLKKKSKNLTLLKWSSLNDQSLFSHSFKSVAGGMLVQDNDVKLQDKITCPTKRKFNADLKPLAEFTMTACKFTKSNAIVLGMEYATGKYQVIGMGAGQPNRVDALRKLAVTKMEENLKIIHDTKPLSEGCTKLDFEQWRENQIKRMVMASDAFFPFDDVVREAASSGIIHIVQPGGSVRDQDSIDACDELGVSMVFTGLRHFNH